MRLSIGDFAPAFEVEDIFGKPIRLQDYRGKKLLLSFYRYASCPLCNLRVQELIQRYSLYEEKGLYVLAFFQSPVESIRRYVGKQDAPFPIIADPQRDIYKRYGVESSVLGTVVAGFEWNPRMRAAHKAGYNYGKMEGNILLVPADFLIGEGLTIETAFYGKDIGDHMPFETIEAYLESGE
ncbi:MAG: AhpC/TSA family protein [Chloroflexi bacterium]|nr:MAG: AhpC/TSA family protein [Chloroflexota bacterium]MBL1196690.1 AhpC/TSA family protein [Chloroflexota bacterium]NOH13983.1 AhpC/TSA family protein [Chloroflexota bacterium]